MEQLKDNANMVQIIKNHVKGSKADIYQQYGLHLFNMLDLVWVMHEDQWINKTHYSILFSKLR